MPGRGDDDDLFGKIFTDFIDPKMDDEMRMLSRELERMFQNFGFDIRMSGGFPPAGPPLPPPNGDHPGAGPPQNPPGNLASNPRDQMLKDPVGTQGDSRTRCRVESPQGDGWQGESLPPRHPGHSFFGIPFGRRDRDTQNDGSRFSDHTFFTTSFNNIGPGDGSRWNQTFVQTIRHGDGTVEKIEKTTQNGRTCTTTTTTDPHGNTTTNTTCDRPAIEGPPVKDNTTSDTTHPVTPVVNKPDKADTPMPPVDQRYNKEETGLLGKFFPFRFFKPKD